MGLGSGWLLTVTGGGVSGSGEALRFAAGGGDAARMGPIMRPQSAGTAARRKEGPPRGLRRRWSALGAVGGNPSGGPRGSPGAVVLPASLGRSRTQAPLPAATSSTIPSPVRGPSVLRAHWGTSRAPRGRG